MSLFYFDFRQGTSYSVDEQGCEFANSEDAYLGAVRAAQEMWSELLVRREDPLACAFIVMDHDRKELFTLPFSEVLDACRSEPADNSRDLPSDPDAATQRDPPDPR